MLEWEKPLILFSFPKYNATVKVIEVSREIWSVVATCPLALSGSVALGKQQKARKIENCFVIGSSCPSNPWLITRQYRSSLFQSVNPWNIVFTNYGWNYTSGNNETQSRKHSFWRELSTSMKSVRLSRKLSSRALASLMHPHVAVLRYPIPWLINTRGGWITEVKSDTRHCMKMTSFLFTRTRAGNFYLIGCSFLFLDSIRSGATTPWNVERNHLVFSCLWFIETIYVLRRSTI